MELLRIIGVFAGSLGLMLLASAKIRRKRLRQLDLIAGSAASVGLVVLGVHPDAFNVVLAFFSFQKGGGGRLIGLLVFSNLLLFVLVYRALLRVGGTEGQLDRLVRELAKRAFRAEDQGRAPIYVVIPAHNEAENIGGVLGAVPSEVDGLATKVLVVVDGATDDTEEVVRGLTNAAVSYTINRGGGAALKAGYEIAIEDRARIIVTLDADGQHCPEELPNLVRPILDGRADLVNGSRVLGHYEKESEVRALGVVLFNWLVSCLTLTRITDCSNGFRAVRVSELARLELRQSQFHASEMLIEALRKGLRVLEVPITIRARQGGDSKKPPTLRYAWGFAKAIISTWLR